MTTTTSNIEEKSMVSGVLREAHFALCSYCFWSASSLDGKLSEICPSCKSRTIDSIPLARKETLIDNHATKLTGNKGFFHRGFRIAG
jgi:hypothetical protein